MEALGSESGGKLAVYRRLTWRGKSLGGDYENINLGYSQDQCCS